MSYSESMRRLKLNDTTLTKLDLQGTLHNKHLPLVTNAIKYNKIVSLTFAWNIFLGADLIIMKALKSNMTIQKLELFGSELSYDSIKCIANVLQNQSNLIDLSLAYCKMNIDGCKEMFVSLQINSSLKSINFSEIRDIATYNNILQDHKCITILSQSLRTNTTLEYLNLHNNGINAEGINILITNLKYNTCIKKLNLSANYMNADDFKHGGYAIADLLRVNSTLEKLDLNQTHLNEGSFGAIMDALCYNTSLKNLILWLNHGIKNNQKINEMLKNNKSLQSIDIHDIGIKSVEYIDTIIESLKLNSSITSLKCDATHDQHNKIKEIIDNRNTNDYKWFIYKNNINSIVTHNTTAI